MFLKLTKVFIKGAARPRRVRPSDDGRGHRLDRRRAAVPRRRVLRVPRDAVVRGGGGRGGRRRVSAAGGAAAPRAAAAPSSSSYARGSPGLLRPLPLRTASSSGSTYCTDYANFRKPKWTQLTID